MEFDPSRTDVRKELFGGTGTVKVMEVSTQQLPSPFTTALLCELDGGGSVGAHVQAHDSELVVAIAGEAVLYVNALPHPMTPGSVAELPLGATMEIDNAHPDQAFRYVIIKATPSQR